MWDALTGRQVFERGVPLPGRAGPVAFTPDGSRLAVSTKQAIALANPETGRIERSFHGFANRARDFSIDPSGSAIAAVDSAGHGMVWAMKDPRVLTGHESYVYQVAVSPDGHRIASGGWDGLSGKPGCIRIWDAATGVPVAAWGRPGLTVRELWYTPDGSRILTDVGRVDGKGPRFWNAATGEPAGEPEGVPAVTSISPDGASIAAYESGRLVLIDRRSLRKREGPACRGEGLLAAPAFSPDGARIAMEGPDHDIIVTDVESLRPVLELSGRAATAYHLAFSPDGRRILAASDDDSVRVWDADTGRRIATLKGPQEDAMCALFAPDGQHIIAGYRDGRILIWHQEDRAVVAELFGHRDYVYSMALTPDGKTLFTASGDGDVRMWGGRSGSEIRQAIRARQELAAEFAPVVERAFADLDDPTKVVMRLREELSGRRREVALQLALAESVRRRGQ